jgi:quercetin dioxygenase-like cupin family protein
MYVIDQQAPCAAPLPGIAHATWAGHDDGVRQLSVWRQAMAPGAATPPHSHDCDELVLCLSGWGELHIDGQAHRFTGGQTLVLPRGKPHQIFCVGPMALETLGIFGASPVGTYAADGQALVLPWRS